MKKTISILLLGIFLFNLAGYRLVYHFAGKQADKNLQVQLDNDEYNEAELVVFKKPMSVPYYSGTGGFEYTQGEVTIEGAIYRYVKKRVINDTVEMYCIPHTQKMELMNARDQFAKLSADFINVSKHQQDAPVNNPVKPFFSDWFEDLRPVLPLPPKALHSFTGSPDKQLVSPFLNPEAKPPESILPG